MKNFKGLTDKQAEVLGQMCIGDESGHSERTLKSLEAKGLLIGQDFILTNGGYPIRIRRYTVPSWVHIEWCQWCAAHVSDKEMDRAEVMGE